MDGDSPVMYQRWLGQHAPAIRRLVVATGVGLVVALVLAPFVPWRLTVLAGWDAVAAVFLVAVVPIIISADAPRTARMATREDDSRDLSYALVQAASLAALVAVAIALGYARRETGTSRDVVIGLAILTVV